MNRSILAWLCLAGGMVAWPALAQTVSDGRPEPRSHLSDLLIHVNQLGFDSAGPKMAVVESATELPAHLAFELQSVTTGKSVFSGELTTNTPVADWFPGRAFYRVDFSAWTNAGTYRVALTAPGWTSQSAEFVIASQILATATIPAITGFYHHQRAASPEELSADQHLLLYGSTNAVDLHGGWCDASGDVSKYFSHLAYANVMSPQQTPLVVWSLANAYEKAAGAMTNAADQAALAAETLYGADYVRRALSPAGYFYMTVFSYFKKDPAARRVVGLLADSKTTADYQCAYREGGGLGIAALAHVSRWHQNGDYPWQEYLAGAERAFAHLEQNNLRYDDDGRENLIDDYGALLAATELWMATDKRVYRDAARKRAHNLHSRQSPFGYFLVNDAGRPFWHAADAGLPVMALARYLEKETDPAARAEALGVIKAFLDYQLRVTGNTNNPFGYARQTFRFRDQIQDG
ncbi:MAG TPA: glycoside hydrolase family 9 protein, partial [Verrucomicrobiae bacterium]